MHLSAKCSRLLSIIRSAEIFLITSTTGLCPKPVKKSVQQLCSSSIRMALFPSREAYLFRMIRQKAEVPTPEVYGVHDSLYGKFILLERMNGISQTVFVRL